MAHLTTIAPSELDLEAELKVLIARFDLCDVIETLADIVTEEVDERRTYLAVIEDDDDADIDELPDYDGEDCDEWEEFAEQLCDMSRDASSVDTGDWQVL
jgi:hypothetical protein